MSNAIEHYVAQVKSPQSILVADGLSAGIACSNILMAVMLMQPKTEPTYCDRRETERSYCGRYFSFLEREAREQERREHEAWVRALTRSYRRPF